MSNKKKIGGKKKIAVSGLDNSAVETDVQANDGGKAPVSLPEIISVQSLTPPKYFTGREEVLEDLAAALKTYRKASLSGISGIGKSSVVYEFAERNAADYQYIIFVRADRPGFDANFDKTCELLLLVFDADDDDESKALKFTAEIDELCAALPANKRLLLIFDNVDEIERLRKFLPQHPKVDTLLTSNFQAIRELGHRVSIGNLAEPGAMLLLYREATESFANELSDAAPEEREAIRQIANLLGFHPFALSLAGLYIRKKRKTFAQYLKHLGESPGSILKDEKGVDAYGHATIYAAFDLPFNSICPSENIPAGEENEVEIVRECLKIASVLAADKMPEEVFRETLKSIFPPRAGFIDDEDNWDQICERLALYGLFERGTENATFSLHRLFRLFLGDKLKNERRTIDAPLAEVLAENFEMFDFTNKAKVERFLPHVGSFLDYLEESFKRNRRINGENEVSAEKTQIRLSLENRSTALLCNRYAGYYKENGQYAIAETYYECSKNICQTSEDIDQTLLATSCNDLALLYRIQGRDEETEPLYKQAIAIYEVELGEDHPHTAIAYNNLALLYCSQGRYEEAEPFYIKDLAICEKELGENHPDTATSYNNLAGLYQTQKKYEEAEPLHKKALEIRENVFGEDHPDTAQSYVNLGSLYYKRGKSPDALELCEKALEIYINVLPAIHPRIQNCEDWIEVIKNSMDK